MTTASERTRPRRRGRPGGLEGADLLSVARDILLREGYAAATMDAIASAARISKQTLYRSHASKQELFAAVVRDWVDRGRNSMRPHLDRLRRTEDLEQALIDLAGVLHAAVLSPPVVQMRSLVIAEAERFPEVAVEYVQRSWERNEALLADVFADLARRGLLAAGDAGTAAQQFTWLVLGAPLDRITLTAGASRFSEEQLAAIARDAVATFLARWRPVSPAPKRV